MRINQFVAHATGLSRRVADKVIEQQHVKINGQLATPGSPVSDSDTVTLDGKVLDQPTEAVTIMMYKPIGYVCSRDGQGSKTIYELLPEEYKSLKPIGRLDKDSSGLLLFTNDGQLAYELTHPSFQKEKTYELVLHKPLTRQDKIRIENGIKLEDGLSHLHLKGQGAHWTVTMHEGRNRQIRRTFVSLGYQVTKLHRTSFGNYNLQGLKLGQFQKI